MLSYPSTTLQTPDIDDLQNWLEFMKIVEKVYIFYYSHRFVVYNITNAFIILSYICVLIP